MTTTFTARTLFLMRSHIARLAGCKAHEELVACFNSLAAKHGVAEVAAKEAR